MAKSRVLTIGIELPGEDYELVSFDSNQTLLDAEIVIFQPTFGSHYALESYNGRPLFGEHDSFKTNQALEHWRSEIRTATEAGKLVVVYLVSPLEYYRDTGERSYSGTGRSRQTTRMVAPISSYQAVPLNMSVTAKSGRDVKLEVGGEYFRPYWSEFAEMSPYETHVEGKFTQVLLKSKSADRIVAASVRTPHGGLLLLVPPIKWGTSEFTQFDKKTGNTYWTSEALRLGKRYVATLAGIAEHLRANRKGTPPPTWVMESEFRLEEERQLEDAISKCSEQLAAIQSKKVELAGQLEDAGSLRKLLFEQGPQLESAVLEALRLFGFKAEPFLDKESEFDAVFECPEGRCLGEAEGKDTKAINIDKFSQLERNIQEDFAREGVTAYAKGVLFGNAYRLAPLSERGDFFTEKCLSAAMRAQAALVKTPDLFEPAKYLKTNPSDFGFAKACREAILTCNGGIVSFPAVPTSPS